ILPSEGNMMLFLALSGAAFGAGVGALFLLRFIRKARPSIRALLLAGLISGLLPSIVLGRILLKGLVQIVVYMVAAPLVGLLFAFGLALLVIRAFRRSTPSRVNHEFKRLQLVSSFFYSVTHGTNDAQRGMR